MPNNGITENEYWSYSLRRCQPQINWGVESSRDVLRERGVGDFVELEAGKRASWFEHAVCLAEHICNRGDVPDTKCDGVDIICVVRERFSGQFLSVSFQECDLWRCGGLRVGQNLENGRKRAHCCGTSSF